MKRSLCRFCFVVLGSFVVASAADAAESLTDAVARESATPPVPKPATAGPSLPKGAEVDLTRLAREYHVASTAAGAGGSTEPQFPRPSRWSRSAYWLGAAADLLTTAEALEVEGTREANPLLRGSDSDQQVLVTGALLKAGAYLIVRRGVRRGWLSRGRGDGLLYGFAGAQVAAAERNRRH